MYNENDAMIDIGPNQNEGEGLLPTLGHSRQDMNPFEEEFDRFWRDNQNEAWRDQDERQHKQTLFGQEAAPPENWGDAIQTRQTWQIREGLNDIDDLNFAMTENDHADMNEIPNAQESSQIGMVAQELDWPCDASADQLDEIILEVIDYPLGATIYLNQN